MYISLTQAGVIWWTLLLALTPPMEASLRLVSVRTWRYFFHFLIAPTMKAARAAPQR